MEFITYRSRQTAELDALNSTRFAKQRGEDEAYRVEILPQHRYALAILDGTGKQIGRL